MFMYTPIHHNIIFDFNNFISFDALMHINYTRYYIYNIAVQQRYIDFYLYVRIMYMYNAKIFATKGIS